MRAYHENMQHNDIPFMASHRRGLSFLAHWHTEIEMVYVIKGNYLVGINDNCHILKEGEMVIICSDDIHYFDHPIPSERVIVIFHPDFINSFGGWPNNVCFETPFITKDVFKNFPTEVVIRIKEIFKILASEYAERKPQYESYVKGLCFELSSLLLRHLPTMPLNKKEKSRRMQKTKILQTIHEFLEENYMNDINLEDLSTLMHISPFHLSRVFRDITGMNFKMFLNNYRLRKADMLLKDTNHSVTDISLCCGFGSVRSFNRIYKAIKGHTPTSIR